MVGSSYFDKKLVLSWPSQVEVRSPLKMTGLVPHQGRLLFWRGGGRHLGRRRLKDPEDSMSSRKTWSMEPVV